MTVLDESVVLAYLQGSQVLTWSMSTCTCHSAIASALPSQSGSTPMS